MPDDPYAFIKSLSDSELRRRLAQRDISEFIVENLVQDRESNGALWRIAQVLGMN